MIQKPLTTIFYYVVNFMTVIMLFGKCSAPATGNDVQQKSTKIMPADPRDSFQVNKLSGAWWLDTNDNFAVFFVEGDSLYYTEHQQSPFFVAISKDTLTLSGDSSVYEFQIRKLSQDSLVLYSEKFNSVTRLFRRNK